MKNPYINLIQTVWHYGKPWRKTIIIYYAAFILAQTFLSLSPYAFGRTIDVLQNFHEGRLHEVIFWLSIGVIVFILFWLFHGPARVKEREVALNIQQSLRLKLYEQLNKLPLKWHQDHHSGNIITRLSRAATALFRFAGDQFIYIETIIKFLIASLFLLWISLPVGLLSLLSCTLAITLVLLFDKKLIPLYSKENEVENHVGAVLFDYLNNMTSILTLRLSKLTYDNLSQRMMDIWPFYKKELIINEVKWFSMGMLLTTLQSIILIAYIIYSLKEGSSILIGTVVMIFRYQSDLSDVFYNFSAQYSELVKMNTDIQSLGPVLRDISQLAEEIESLPLSHWQHINIQELTFTHQAKNIFDHLSFSIARGEKIALIGLSGGGKSTLLNILRGLYQPSSVSLNIDRQHFNNLQPLQSITTLIPQDPEIFENTILFNITLDVPAPRTIIENAIQLSAFDEVMQKLPQGLNTDIREKGLNLSVGQKQRLALARGLFAANNSSLILMDEPTSSVDLPTEKTILSRLMQHFSDSTLIISLHRLHLLPLFSRIIMLDNGKIIADGSPKKLLNEEGPVRELWLHVENK